MCFVSGRLWGAQTQRSLQNFDIGGERERMPVPIIRAFGVLKKCAAKVQSETVFLVVFCAWWVDRCISLIILCGHCKL